MMFPYVSGWVFKENNLENLHISGQGNGLLIYEKYMKGKFTRLANLDHR